LKLGYLSTGMSILIVFFTIKLDELPCGLSQFLDGGWNMPAPSDGIAGAQSFISTGLPFGITPLFIRGLPC